jgi:hypothetical protein
VALRGHEFDVETARGKGLQSVDCFEPGDAPADDEDLREQIRCHRIQPYGQKGGAHESEYVVDYG